MRDLNRIIMELAPEHTIRECAPSTFRDIFQFPFIIWAGGSSDTIYDDPAVNWAFRAWHDAEHIAGMYDFTFEGEIATCERQVLTLLHKYPRADLAWIKTIQREVIGQATFFQQTGTFPKNQRAWHEEQTKCATLTN